MAKERKGQAGAGKGIPRWSPPEAADIKSGDILQYYSPEGSFTLRVLSVKHEGEWIFGFPTSDPPDVKLGPMAIPRKSCMTLDTAERVLSHLPSIRIDAPPGEAPDQV